LNQAVSYFLDGILALCILVMRGVGWVDGVLTIPMQSADLSARTQAYILLVVTVVLVVLALRVLGGLLGWLVFLFLVLLLLHHILPEFLPQEIMIPGPLGTTL
jgi:hypothetical protein